MRIRISAALKATVLALSVAALLMLIPACSPDPDCDGWCKIYDGASVIYNSGGHDEDECREMVQTWEDATHYEFECYDWDW